MSVQKVLTQLRDDPVYFCEKLLKFPDGRPFIPYWYQAKILRSKSKRMAICSGRQIGKTTVIAAKAIHFAYMHPGTNTLIVSRGLRQSMHLFSFIQNFILDSPILRRSVSRMTRTVVELKNGSHIKALPCSQTGDNLRGETADMVIMDETAFMPETVIASVIMPMLAVTEKIRGTGYAIMISTPWGREHIFYRCYTNPEWFIMHIPSSECPNITERFLREQKALVGELRFDTEYQAQFREDAMAMFTQDMIRGAIEEAFYETRLKKGLPHLFTDPELEAFVGIRTGNFSMGIDIGKRIDYSVISIFQESDRIVATDLASELGRPLEELETEFIKPAWNMVYQKKFELGTKLTDVCEHAKWLTTKFKMRYAAMDMTQVGEMPFEVIKSELQLLEGVYFSAQVKQDVMMSYYLMVEQRRVGLPYSEDYEENITQMAEQQAGYSGVKPSAVRAPEEKGVMKYWHPQGRHDDRLISCALAIYSTVHRVKGGRSGMVR